LKRIAKEQGLPFGQRTMTCNSRLAQELGLWAENRGKGGPFHTAAFRAYFVDRINLAKIPHLLELVKNIGLPIEAAEKVLISRSYKEAVDLDWMESKLKNITAIPTFVIDDHKLVGAQSYENLVSMVTEKGITKRNENCPGRSAAIGS